MSWALVLPPLTGGGVLKSPRARAQSPGPVPVLKDGLGKAPVLGPVLYSKEPLLLVVVSGIPCIVLVHTLCVTGSSAKGPGLYCSLS
jgi:hypothetical protein